MNILTGLINWLAPGAAAAPAKSVTLSDVNAGLSALKGAWPALEAAIAGHFRNLGADATLIEDLADDVAQIFPPAIYVADAAELVAFIASLGVVQTSPIPTGSIADGINPGTGQPIGF